MQSGASHLDLAGVLGSERHPMDPAELAGLLESLGQLAGLEELNLSGNGLAALPESLGQLLQLRSLDLSENQLDTLPDAVGDLLRLERLNVARNRLTTLPASLCRLKQLQFLGLPSNQLTALPDWVVDLPALRTLNITNNRIPALPAEIGRLSSLDYLCLGYEAGGNPIAELPDSIGNLQRLTDLTAQGCLLQSLPASMAQLENLNVLDLKDNPLSPELAAAYEEGLDAVRRYLRAKAEGGQVVLNEAKLILVGEGEVGKSCLLGALRGDPWEERRPSTHGIEVKPVLVSDAATGTSITLNGWDFGGQRVYRPTHQLFFSAPAVYLVVWKPREGPQQGLVKEWIKLVKNREPEAKILVVATHGGPKARQPDIDRQEIWDLFGKETVVDFFFVESRPPVYDDETGSWVGESAAITGLKEAIARVAASLPEMGLAVPKRWDDARTALKNSGAAYLPLDKVLAICTGLRMDEAEARNFIRIAHRLGHLIHYAHDPALRDVVVLKPDWLSTAISYVLDDKQTRDSHGLVAFARLSELWNDPARPAESRYDARLHPLFLRLMERFDLSYKVAVAAEADGALWQQAVPRYTSLVAQLVPDLRPAEPEISAVWPDSMAEGESQQVQICRIVETSNGQSATAEGLFYQLIVRLHKYSLGRVHHSLSVHWQRGLVLDDDYNGRGLLEHTGNDVRISVRAVYPHAFLAVLTREVKYLVESFWAGLRCDVMVPCIAPCGRNAPGTGLYEVHKLVESTRRQRAEYPCPVCNEWQGIDGLLRNAPAARPAPLQALLAEFTTIRGELSGARAQLTALRGEAMGRFDTLDSGTQRILSRVDDGFSGLMQALTDEAREGPRLFSFKPADPGFFDRPKWLSSRFRLTLWCEHSRLPLPALDGEGSKAGVYELDLPREWFVKAAPFLKVLTGTLSLVLPVAASATKLVMDEAAYKGLEKELDLGQKSLDSVLKGGEKLGGWLGRSDAPDLERSEAVRAQGAILRQLHLWLKEKDPAFGGLVRVQNKQQQFLWVHAQFEKDY